MTQRFLSDDEWFVVYYHYGSGHNSPDDGFRAIGPFTSRVVAEKEAGDRDCTARVVHSVFTS